MTEPTLGGKPQRKPLEPGIQADKPIRPAPALPLADRVFHHSARAVGTLVLVIFGSIGLFLAIQSVPTLRHYGLRFFTETDWLPESDKIGIASVVYGTVVVAVISLLVSFPLSLTTALFISEYAPLRLRTALVAMVDLMAAVPSIVYGLWGFFLLQPLAVPVAHWLHLHLGFLPFFRADTDPGAAIWEQNRYIGSAFIAGLVVSMMVIPMGCAVMREVFAQAPTGEREAALALGATRWGMIRAVVLPFGRGGIVGGTMLSLGRALGETIAVLLIISPAFDVKASVIEVGANTVAALIAGRFGEATAGQLSALLTAGFVLFLITLLVNTLAAVIVSRSRSGASTEI